MEDLEAVGRSAQAIRIAGGTPYAQFIPQNGAGSVMRSGRRAGAVTDTVAKPPTTTAQAVGGIVDTAATTAAAIAQAQIAADAQRTRSAAEQRIAEINAQRDIELARIGASGGGLGTGGGSAPATGEKTVTTVEKTVSAPWTSDPIKVGAVVVGGAVVLGGLAYGLSRLMKKRRGKR